MATKSNTDLLGAVWTIVNEHDCESFSPSENIKKLGGALVAIGELLDGVPVDQGRRVIKAVAILHDIEL